ncbi:MAG: IS481 family transposase [Chloroflexi bacterium]|nr:IS481 family transposase [Chloroflexota bacterium]
MSWRVTSVVDERKAFCELAEQKIIPFSDLCARFGVSYKTGYKWLSRYEESGVNGLHDRSRKPRRSPNKTSEEIESQIMELKKIYTAWGARKLHRLLDIESEKPCVTTVHRILKRNGLVNIPEKVDVAEEMQRFERGRPNELWQIDFTSPVETDSGARFWPMPVLDDHSRYCLGLQMFESPDIKSAITGFRDAALRNGLPKEILTDHGSSFGTSHMYAGRFTIYLWALNINHVRSRYNHPQTQGKLERFNKTLKKECLSSNRYNTISDWNKCLEEYRNVYNEIRPHWALGGDVPACRYEVSNRRFKEPDRNMVIEGDGLVHRRVDMSGKVYLLGHQFNVGQGLVGWRVSARHEGGGVWTIMFMGRLICQVKLSKNAELQPKKVLPMS